MTGLRRSFYKSELRQLNPESRQAIPGTFVALSDGVTRYDLTGPDHGPTLVMIHGAGLNSLSTWDPLAENLIRNGCGVLRYDLFGQGYSDRPDKEYGPELFVRQLEDLLSELKVTGPLSLVGFSMGAAVAAWYANKHRESIADLTLIAAGGINVELGLGIRVLKLPFVGESILRLYGERLLVNRYRGMRHAPEYVRHALDLGTQTLGIHGTRRALLSVLRNMPVKETVDIYRQIGQSKIPVLAVFGKEDRAAPVAVSAEMRKLIPSAEIHEITNASHGLVFDNAGEIGGIILDFLKVGHNIGFKGD